MRSSIWQAAVIALCRIFIFLSKAVVMRFGEDATALSIGGLPRANRVQATLPEAAIGDVISGFPGETAEHFMETVQFFEELPVAIYTPYVQ